MYAPIAANLIALKSLKHTGRPLKPDEVDSIIDQLRDLAYILVEAKHANSVGFKMTNGKTAHEGFEAAIAPYISDHSDAAEPVVRT